MTLTNPTSTNHDLGNYCKSTDPENGDKFLDSFLKTQGKTRTSFSNTKAFESYKELCSEPHGKAQPCGGDTLGKIHRSLKKFFIVLRGLKKYLDKYVNQTLNAIQNLQSEIQATITEIVAVLKTLVHRAREWVLKKVKKGIEDQIDKLTTPQTTEKKKALLARIIEEIFCKFDDIIAGLFNFVGDFLYSLIGKVINVPFCAVESFINALLSKLLNDIDKALKPFFDKINKALAPVSKIMGSVFQVIDYILGFEGFLCEKPECNDELKEFEAGPWGRPQNTKTDNWSSFNFSSGISKSVNGWMDDFFGSGKGGSYVSPGGCYTGDFNCGVNVQIFGGGGSGAAGAAVVNKIGQVVGVNLFNGGGGYTSPPFVSFVDPGGCGNYASGHPNLNDLGEIEDIVIDNPGIGYTDTFPLSPVIRNFTANPTSIEVGKNILFSWESENSTSVSLSAKEYTLTGYSKLPVTGNQSVGVSSASISFPAGKSVTKVTYTITAIRDVPGWERQETTKDVEVEVYLPGSSPSTPTPSTTSALPPTIVSFDANPTTATVGRVIRFNWQTLDTTFVGLGLSTRPGIVTPIYDNLIANGSGSIVLPNDLVFPTDGSNIINTYVLKATNTNAPLGSNTDIKYVSVEIVSPKSPLSNWTPPERTPITSTAGGEINLTGTAISGLGGNDGEINSGSLEDLRNRGTYTTGIGDTILFGGGGGIGGGSNIGGGDTPLDNIFRFLPTDQQSYGGAGIDPSGISTPSGTREISTGTANLFGDDGLGTTIDRIGENLPDIDIVGGIGGGGIGGGGLETIIGGIGELLPGVDSGSVIVGDGGVEIDSGTSAGNNEVISEIHDVEIINTGTGYTSGDTVEIVGGNNGAELEIETTPDGQIVDVKVISGGYGFVTIPQIRINTVDGLGAKFRPILRFIPASKFNQRELDRIGTDKLLRIVDCVLR